LRILVAEDNLVSRHMLEAYLKKWGYEVLVVTDGQQAWAVLQQEDAPRLAVLDWMLPGLDGVSICKEVRKLNPNPYVYLILLTAKGLKEDVVAGLEAGADDYLTKPFDPFELRARLQTGVRIVELQASLVQAQLALREQATHDPLTGLLNRGATLDSLHSEMNRGRREKKALCVLMADVDHFKQINDTYGHLVGDEILCEVARRLRRSTRDYDTVGRFGGEEFLLVLPGCAMTQGVEQAERIRESLVSRPFIAKEHSIQITISLGVAIAEGPDQFELDTVLATADEALYRAKALGRNRVELGTRATPGKLDERPKSDVSSS
jgi:diguanylate cyclase (GGDEF)-like protein